jgi:DNA invertase Pin-like site-specific DNA recombinase
MKAIAYLRVSTKEQGSSRLGIKAQRAAVLSFCECKGIVLLDEVEQVASGGLDLPQRPVLGTPWWRQKRPALTSWCRSSTA